MLNEEQQHVLDHIDMNSKDKYNILVQSNAGVGKTFTITLAIEKLLVDGGILEDEIMLVTYTRSAAIDMKQRLMKRLSQREHAHRYKKLSYANTMHALAKKILIRYGLLEIENQITDVDEILVSFLLWLKADSIDAHNFKKSIQYIFVDEVQDSNEILIQILEIFKPFARIIAVGDEFQSIYEFSGASVLHMRNFPIRFAPCKTFSLRINYRCNTPIVNFVNALMMSGNMKEYGNKKLAMSVEMYKWEKDNIPVQHRISQAEKPILNHFITLSEAITKTAQKYANRKNTIKTGEVGILCRLNTILNLLRCELDRLNVPYIHITDYEEDEQKTVKSDEKTETEEEEKENEQDNITAHRRKLVSTKEHAVILCTIHASKGRQFLEGDILTLENDVFLDSVTKDYDLAKLLESERRVLYVGCTRFKNKLTLWNYTLSHCVFLYQISQKFDIHTLITSKQYYFTNGLPSLQEKLDSDDKNKGDVDLIINQSNQNILKVKVTKWLKNLNGSSSHYIRNHLLPNPYHIKITTPPLFYDIEKVNIEEEDYENTDLSEMDRAFHHSDFIVTHQLQSEFTWFLICFLHRLLHFDIGKFTSPYFYFPIKKTRHYFQELEKENNKSDSSSSYPSLPNIVITKRKELEQHVNSFLNQEHKWQDILLETWYTAAYTSIPHHQLRMLYLPVEKKYLVEYIELFEEIHRTLHYLVHSYQGIKNMMNADLLSPQQWKSIQFDENVKLVKEHRVFLYLIIGPRLILLNLEENEYGLSQLSMLKAISYACIENIVVEKSQSTKRKSKSSSTNSLPSPQSKITYVQVYQIFSRRICSLNLKKWNQGQNLLEFLKQNKANDFTLLNHSSSSSLGSRKSR